jgi:hypothetical protein
MRFFTRYYNTFFYRLVPIKMGTRARCLNMYYDGKSAQWADNISLSNIQGSRVRPAIVKPKTPALLKEDEYIYYML